MTDIWTAWIERAGGLIDHNRAAEGAPPRTLQKFMRWTLTGAWPVLFVGAFVSMITGVTEVLSMYLLGRVVDVAGSGEPLGQYWLLFVGSILLLMVARPLLQGISAAFQSVVIAPNTLKLVLSRLHRWTLGQSVDFFDNDFAGRLAQKQMQTANSMTEIVVETVNALFFGLASVVGALFLVGGVNGWLVIIMLGWFAGYLSYLRYFLPRIRARAKRQAAARAAVTGQVVDTITNIKTVKLFARGEHEDSAALGALDSLRHRALEFGDVSSRFRLGLMVIAGSLPVLLVGFGLTVPGVTAGEIAAMGAIAIRLAQMTGWISFTLMAIYRHVGEVEDGMRTLTPPHELTDADGATELVVRDGEIRFRDLSFSYGGGPGGIHNIDLTIAPGEKLGIVGASGAGKSTLVAILLRLYDAEGGRVEIDGQDIAKVTQESLRRQIGMVTQDTAMFNRSARANVLYGRPDATEEEMIAATTKAEAHDFIQTLRDHQDRHGYEAHLGERGVKLSGGQRQRIALARALLKDAPILVLDEATSALDSEVEASIQTALTHAMEGKTVIAIAHRLSTLSEMDRIIVLDDGRIAEEGTHQSLLEAEGLYARYWNRQSGGFIGALAAE